MKRKSEVYLQDILEAIERIKEYTKGASLEKFSKKKMAVDAVLRNLEIIGEAATQIQKEIKEKRKEIPWRDIQDFRIVVAHHYWKINLDRIWDVIQTKLEPLKDKIQKILQEERL